ncbi:MAG TPA: BMC domain-containing protein [Candidatus Copromorpha excrementigallinarum]|uniref:BMC domain-containing protein n=1 Tax=Candidatus Allocopromorpha excrementigallinarum TaxID=2840742 RepID=A0A9D1I0R7_9FIRM|nr:BMC domain-containing protein [Candidatus Copromorpha excrementigallinarum]
METIGFLELNNIAKGIEAADAMLKAAEVELVLAKPSCPGKYIILIHGEVAAVKSSVDAGCKRGGTYVIDETVIASIHPQVIEAVTMCVPPARPDAIGILEFMGITASIKGADAAVKAADVDLIEVRLGMGIGGKSYVTLTGDVAAVTESVKCGGEAGAQSGLLMDGVVIPHPREELIKYLY